MPCPFQMELSQEEQLVLSDSFSSDDSDVEALFAIRRQQMVVAVLAVKEFEDRYAKRRQGSKVGRLCIQAPNRIFCFAVLLCGFCSAARRSETAFAKQQDRHE